jgi:DNA-binding NarL/FixJ family response regulator
VEDLEITERTVETHADKILRKLSFRSRTQIVTWVIEQGLLPVDPD